MYELVLLRHAQAEPITTHDQDFARALTTVGRAQAGEAARQLRVEGIAPERLLYSPARRTADTRALLDAALQLPADAVQAVPELYLATPVTLRAVIARHRGAAHRLLIVGHNPGLSELGAELSERHVGGHLTTGTYWRIALDEGSWRELGAHTA